MDAARHNIWGKMLVNPLELESVTSVLATVETEAQQDDDSICVAFGNVDVGFRT